MFHKLRTNLLVLNLTLMTIVIFSAFTLIFVTTYNQEKQVNMQRMSIASGIQVSTSSRPSGQIVTTYEKFDISGSFEVLLHNDQIVGVASLLPYDLDFYINASTLALQQKQNKGTIRIGAEIWNYQVESKVSLSPTLNQNPMGNLIEAKEVTFLNVTTTHQLLQSLFFRLLVIASGILIILYFVSRYFAKKAILPVEAAYEKQKQFISDASHELKTPLAVIQTNLDVLAMEEAHVDQVQWIHYIQEETKKMNKLVNDLLTLARNDELEEQVLLQEVNISNIVSEVVMLYEVSAFESSLAFESTITNDLKIKANKEQMIALLHILLDNALKYSNGSITVNVRKQGKHVLIEVMNSSETIPAEQLSHLFERFYRVDSARVRSEGGYGLGLSIAKSLVEQNKGKISVKSMNKKTSFILQFECM